MTPQNLPALCCNFTRLFFIFMNFQTSPRSSCMLNMITPLEFHVWSYHFTRRVSATKSLSGWVLPASHMTICIYSYSPRIFDIHSLTIYKKYSLSTRVIYILCLYNTLYLAYGQGWHQSCLTSFFNGNDVMLPREWRWCRIVQVQSGGKVMWAALAWNKHDLYLYLYTHYMSLSSNGSRIVYAHYMSTHVYIVTVAG